MVQDDAKADLVLVAVTAVPVNALDCYVSLAVGHEFGFCREVDDDEPAEEAEGGGDGTFDDEDPCGGEDVSG